ncbi:MAG: MarR family transcriptional regulator [Candidatus Omnitrophica bacterium]|nr:MarR family transcriptional regulator [Candidatus Omnitrophota bacterium]
MAAPEKIDFGGEVSRILPLILREVTKKQMTVFSKGGLSLPQVVVLDLLREKGACMMGDLARTLHLTMSAVTGIVDKMIKLNMIKRERSKEDRRIVRVILLEKGEKTAKQISKERKNISNDIFSVLSGSERREYLKLLKKIYNDLRKRT